MPHTLRFRVEPSDVDELQHVNNLVYLRWVQEVALAHSERRCWLVFPSSPGRTLESAGGRVARRADRAMLGASY